jgi:hypothetical protein
MSPRMSQGCALVLLLAMTLAMAAGLMAWGPITLAPPDHVYADQRVWAGIPSAFNTLSCLPLLGASVWGMLATSRQRWPATLRGPWLGFFALCGAMTLASLLEHADPGDGIFALAHGFGAAAFIMLGLAFMAERMDALFGTRPALAAGMAVAGCATAWWFIGQWSFGQGDLRPVFFFEWLPLLLLPAGALSLRGDHTRPGDWFAALGLYVLSRAAGLGDSLIFGWTSGTVSGHSLMHLLLAGSAASLAYRASVVPGGSRSFASVLGEPTHRSTSLNTSS